MLQGTRQLRVKRKNVALTRTKSTVDGLSDAFLDVASKSYVF